MGFTDLNSQYDFIIKAYAGEAERKLAKAVVTESDAMIWSFGEEFFQLRMRHAPDKPVFRYEERFFRRGLWMRFVPQLLLRRYRSHLKYRKNPNFGVLCASAYTSYDLSLHGFPASKCLKWGYFPEARQYDPGELFGMKRSSAVRILWVARMISCKHPAHAIEAAKYLRDKGIEFKLDLIGEGEVLEAARALSSKYGLDGQIAFLPFMPNEEVKRYMERADIFLFTSDFHEGWGVVLNEAMNCGCAVVASHAAGATPYLIEDGTNGFIYAHHDVGDLCRKVYMLAAEPAHRKEMGEKAYRTICDIWNARRAAEILVSLFTDRLKHLPTPIEAGPGSPAGIYEQDWYGKR